MLENAKKQFVSREQVDEEDLMVFMELTLGSLLIAELLIMMISSQGLK